MPDFDILDHRGDLICCCPSVEVAERFALACAGDRQTVKIRAQGGAGRVRVFKARSSPTPLGTAQEAPSAPAPLDAKYLQGSLF